MSRFARGLLALFFVACTSAKPPTDLSSLANRAAAPDVVRVATWNIERVGAPGSAEYGATLDVLRRVDADVWVFNEIAGAGEVAYLDRLAEDLGFGTVYGADVRPWSGYQRNAVISRLALLDADDLDPVELSGDPEASDMSRPLLRVTLETPSGEPLVVLGGHWKSGVNNRNELRRVVTSWRARQALADLDPEETAVVVMGDMNAEIDRTEVPAQFTSVPSGMPASYRLGADMLSAMDHGLANDPFGPLMEAGYVALDAAQRSGDQGTRPASGKRLDYIWASSKVYSQPHVAMVMNCLEESLPSPLALEGLMVHPWSCEAASDHYPVVADLVVSAGVAPAGPGAPGVGDLRLTEVHPDPNLCSDSTGEWVEITNQTGEALSLDGVTLEDASGRVGSLDGYVIDAYATATFGRSTEGRFCGEVSASGFYGSSLSLNNTGDTLTVWSGDLAIDAAPSYTRGQVEPGASVHRLAHDVWCTGDATPGWVSEASDCG